MVNQILRDCPIWNNLRNICLIEDKEIEIISEIYRRTSKKDENDPMGQIGQGAGVGPAAGPGAESTSAGADAGARGRPRWAEGSWHSDPEEEYQISRDKGQVMDAIDAFFALADDSNVCIRCGESGHTNCECNTKDDDPVKIALINLRKKFQGEEVDEEPQGEDSKEPEGTYQATGEGEYMFLRPIPLSVISDRAHGELSINGVKIGEKGPATRDALSRLVDIASQKGVTMTCKDVIEAGKYSDHKMYNYENLTSKL